MKSLRFNVFGRQVLVTASADGWVAFYLSDDGKRRPASNLVIPSDIPETELEQYLGDLCHEWATPRHPGVERLE